MLNKNLQQAYSTDYSPIIFSLSSESEGEHNNSVCENSGYINSMKKHVISALENLKYENEQSVWEYLKCKIKRSSENVSKEAARSNKTESSVLEPKLKILVSKIRYKNDPKYIHCKEEFDKLYKGKINSAIIKKAGATGQIAEVFLKY